MSLGILWQANHSIAAPLVYGAPYPINAFTHNTFFDFAGNLIGLIVVISFLIPLSVLLRSMVLEKELRLKEELLMMGATRASYYGSILITHGVSFLITSLICAAEIGFSCYKHSSASLVAVLFILFAMGTLAFTLAMVPIFKNSRVAALVGPLVFFGCAATAQMNAHHLPHTAAP